MKLVNLIILLVSILLPINADDVIRSGNTTEKDFLIEAILPKSSAAGGDRFSQLVVVDLIGGQNHAVVEEGEILSMGRGEPYQASPVEAFRVMYTTNSSPKDGVIIDVEIGNFVLVQETSEGVYEEVVIDDEKTELTPTVTCVRSSLFSNPEDESNEADVDSYKNVSSAAPPSYGAEGFNCTITPEDNDTENKFSVKFNLQRYLNNFTDNNGWIQVYNSSTGRDEWKFGGASYKPSSDELLKGYFELDQTFSIKLPDVTTPGLYKTDVTVSVRAV